MGYSLTTASASRKRTPGVHPARPKTHTPGPQLQQRGHRYYKPDSGRWLSRDPIGEEDAQLYLFTRNDAVNLNDYLGAAVIIYDVDATADATQPAPGVVDVTTQPTAYRATYNAGIQILTRFKAAVQTMSDSVFATSAANGLIKKDGAVFNGTKAAYIALIDREITMTKFYRVQNAGSDREAFFNVLAASAGTLQEPYDVLAVTAHGVRDESGPTGIIRFNGVDVPQTDTITTIRNRGRPVRGRLVIASCFRTWTAGGNVDQSRESVILVQARPTWSRQTREWIGSDLLPVCRANLVPFKLRKQLGTTELTEGAQYESYSQ